MKDLETKMAEAVRALVEETEARALRQVELPNDFANRIIAQIQLEESKSRNAEPNFLGQFFNMNRAALAATAAVVITVLALIPFMNSKPVELAMTLPPLKAGTPTEAGTLIDPSVIVLVKWKKRTLQIPLKSGGKLTGEINPATNVAPLPLVFDVTLWGTNAGQPVSGTGQLVVMPQNPSDRLDRFSTNALLWLKLDLKLRTGGQEEPLYRVFGAP